MLKTSYKFIGLICAVILLAVITPVSTAHAQALFGIPTVSDFIAQGIALIMNQLVALMSLFVMIAGYLLNFSINLTLQIKTFVDSTPAIYTTWRTIRDIAGLTMIFFLLYAAFQLIIGQKSSKFGQLIKNVVFAGIIVNFSFFLAGLGIDASNIVSVQLYNAIAPANSLNPNAAKTAIINGTWRSSVDGGLSDIFMNSLHIQSFYKTKLADNVTANTSKGAAAAQGLNQSVGASFASAPVKIFLTASAATRASRRARELDRADDVDVAAVQADLARRDHLDASRAASPLTEAADAVELDTTKLDVGQVVAATLAVVRERTGVTPGERIGKSR